MRDYRRHPRQRMLVDIAVECRDTGDLLGTLVDLTFDGLMLAGNYRIVPGRMYHLELLLPAMIEGRESIQVLAPSLWTARQPISARRLSGFGKLSLDRADEPVVQRLIDDYALGPMPAAPGMVDCRP